MCLSLDIVCETVEAVEPLTERHAGGADLMVDEWPVLAVMGGDPERLPVHVVHDDRAYTGSYETATTGSRQRRGVLSASWTRITWPRWRCTNWAVG